MSYSMTLGAVSLDWVVSYKHSNKRKIASKKVVAKSVSTLDRDAWSLEPRQIAITALTSLANKNTLELYKLLGSHVILDDGNNIYNVMISDVVPEYHIRGAEGRRWIVRINCMERQEPIYTPSYYSETNQSGTSTMNDTHPAAIQISACGQSFQNPNTSRYKLWQVLWYLRRNSNATGKLIARLYAHSGTFGINSKPTGVALASSELVDVAQIGRSLELTTFTFNEANQYVFAPWVEYCIDVEIYDKGNMGVTHNISFGTDTTSPTGSGNFFWYALSSWSATSARDACWYLHVKENF